MIRTLPRQTTNPNVPRGVLLLAETVTADREITTTWYVDRAGGLWKVGDWCTDRPAEASLSLVCRLTFLTEGLLRGIWQSWVEAQDVQIDS